MLWVALNRTRFQRRPRVAVAVAALSVVLASPQLTYARGLPPGIRPTTDGLHVGQVFDYATPGAELLRGVDILWGASQPVGPGGVYRASYLTFDRDDAQRTLSWWQSHHPGWVEYQCDRKTPAYEYGQNNGVRSTSLVRRFVIINGKLRWRPRCSAATAAWQSTTSR